MQFLTERGTIAPTFQPTLLWHGRLSQLLLSTCLCMLPMLSRPPAGVTKSQGKGAILEVFLPIDNAL